MPESQSKTRQASTTSGEHGPSTMIFVAIANVSQPEKGVGIVKRSSGQDLIDLFHEIDRPDSESTIVSAQLAIHPELNGTSRWTAETIVDFARIKLLNSDTSDIDTYAYRLVSDSVFRDNAKIAPSDILEWRSLCEVCCTDTSELLAQQKWLSTVIARIVNAVNFPEDAEEP
ncbi:MULTISPECIES: hypothetical protein [unclassified Pseudomonas]|uniref:hypothetical protein n=1 Tax=unclassified Pseudomonas TaxID=196821 RepID=UPI000A1FD759|nr:MULTISPECIES: hypothetical protein [unclassified Pseudomonas]